MKIAIATIAYNTPRESIFRLWETAFQDEGKHHIVGHLFLHSHHDETKRACYEAKDSFKLCLYDYGVNRGVATSWNDAQINGFETGADVVIICNDDIYFSEGDIDKLATKAIQNPDRYMVSCAGYHIVLDTWRPSHGYSCFALNKIALTKIGCFDQNFHPAYGEDLDHHRRATMLGLVEENCSDTMVYHAGSATIRRDEQLSLANIASQMKNHEYFRLKWGSNDHKGGYAYPFNNPEFDLYIAPKNRHRPYGPYDRKDVLR